MASEAQVPEPSSAFERLSRQRELSLFFPFFLGFTSSSNTQNPDQEATFQRQRVIIINPFTQGMVVIEGSSDLDSFLGELASKSGYPPASKASIEALPRVDINEIVSQDSECAICLEEWKIDGDSDRDRDRVVVVKEMPCKHRFHDECIEKWLEIHGSCPVCRYKMPVDDDELGKKRNHEVGDGDEERRRVEREIWVSFSLNDRRTSDDSNRASSIDSNHVDNTSMPDQVNES